MDHNEIHIYGPPGTGKTTYMTDQIRKAAERFTNSKVLVASFTKTAAQELSSRDINLPFDMVGTLHSLCYRLLGQPDLAETHVEEFNELYPHFSVSNQKGGVEESAVDVMTGGSGNGLLAEYQLLRNKLIPVDLWRQEIQGFAHAWDTWKADAGLTDFTDLIERGLHETVFAPNAPKVGFFDEAQDFTPLQLQLVRHWGERMQWFLLAGDDDQSIFDFTGATPEALIGVDLPGENIRVLNQSYRLPRRVQARAVSFIRRVENRQEKEYKARDYEGELRFLDNSDYADPDGAIHDAKGYLDDGKTVMFLASCAHMLTRLIGNLRDQGIPFHNPFRRSRGDWNPLKPAGGVSNSARLISFLNPAGPDLGDGVKLWTVGQLNRWLPLCRAQGLLTRGAKTKLERIQKDGQSPEGVELLTLYRELFEPEGLDAAVKRDPDWLASKLLAQFAPRMAFPLRIRRGGGDEALTAQPRVIVGTIHSVKGGQADVVYLFPDISITSHRATYRRPGHDAVVRQMYVGMTRCRESLIICRPATQWFAEGVY